MVINKQNAPHPFHWMQSIPLLILLSLGGPSHSADTDSLPKQRMIATFYADMFVGRHTSSGEIFDQNKPTAAHKSIKLGTWVRVTNTRNGQQIVVKINDRCPKKGVIDLSRSAAQSIGIRGTAPVTVEILPSEEYAQQLIESLQTTTPVGLPPSTPDISSLKQSYPDKSKTQKPATQATPPTATQTKPSTKTTSQKLANNRGSHHSKSSRYNITLGHAATIDDAHEQMNRIPFIYHEHIQLTPDHRKGGFLIIYDQPLSRQQALETRKALNKVFPKSIITQIKR